MKGWREFIDENLDCRSGCENENALLDPSGQQAEDGEVPDGCDLEVLGKATLDAEAQDHGNAA